MEAGRIYREDDQLKRGEAQLYQQQQQIDELRRLLREQVARQATIEEYLKQSQSQIIHVREQVDRQGSEFQQAFQVRALEEHRIKQDVADLQVRVSEPIKPLRELRSQLTEIVEKGRRETEQVGLDKHALEKLATQIRDTHAQIGRLDNQIKDLREAIKITANAQEYYQRELERLVDIIHNTEQVVRRQADEFREEIKAIRIEVQLFTNRITRLEDLQRVDSARIEEIPPVLDVLRLEDERIFSNIVRTEKVMSDRFAMLQDRLEEIRQQTETQFFNINHQVTGQVESDSVRFTQLDDRIRVVDAQIQEAQLRTEQIKQVQDAEVYDIYQMIEVLYKFRAEQSQAEFEMMRQNRAKSQAAGLSGRRALRTVRRRIDLDEESPSDGYAPGRPDDNSI
jgi:chromosome segregation ATPase